MPAGAGRAIGRRLRRDELIVLVHHDLSGAAGKSMGDSGGPPSIRSALVRTGAAPRRHRAPPAPPPHLSVGKRKGAARLAQHLGRRPGCRGGGVPPVQDHRGIGEVLVELVAPLDHAIGLGRGDGDEVPHREVLHRLAQPDPAGVRTHRHAELGREQDVRDVLVDARDPAGIDLHDIDRIGLEQLLEDDALRTCAPPWRCGSERPRHGCAHARGCRRDASAPRPMRARTARARGSTRSPARRPRPGSHRWRSRHRRRLRRGRYGSAAGRPRGLRRP